MSPEGLQIFAVVFAVWGVAVAIKAFNCLRNNEDYVFSMWDGGMIRAGKRLNKMGKQIKLVVGVLEAVGCIGLLTGAIPLQTACYLIIFVAIVSLVSDFVTAA
ncbi:MAG TPA: hypothetical protein VFV99_14250 [Kofleriaceae bacterium]|nr:hypothetical protein [Kofleriaceae bacterium]